MVENGAWAGLIMGMIVMDLDLDGWDGEHSFILVYSKNLYQYRMDFQLKME